MFFWSIRLLTRPESILMILLSPLQSLWKSSNVRLALHQQLLFEETERLEDKWLLDSSCSLFLNSLYRINCVLWDMFISVYKTSNWAISFCLLSLSSLFSIKMRALNFLLPILILLIWFLDLSNFYCNRFYHSQVQQYD